MALQLKGTKAAISTRFMLEMDGMDKVSFNSISGIGMSTTPAETKLASPNARSVVKIPGNQEPTDLTLSRQLDKDKSLWDWVAKFTGNAAQDFKNGSVVLYDWDGKELIRYNFIEAWPSKISISGFDAAGKDVVTEELTLTTYQFHRAK